MRQLGRPAAVLAAACTATRKTGNAKVASSSDNSSASCGQGACTSCTRDSSGLFMASSTLNHRRGDKQSACKWGINFGKLTPDGASNGPVKCEQRVEVQLSDLRTCGGGEQELKAAYRVGDLLGEGGFATVRRAIHRHTGLDRALKYIHVEHPTAKDWDAVCKEVDAMMDLDHPNIARLFEYYKTANDLILVVEFCAGGTLEDRLAKKGGKLSTDEAMLVLRHMLRAALCCHMHGLVHRDLKPNNFCFASADPNNLSLKLIDFGLSRSCEPDCFREYQAGTLDHCAPEVLQDRKRYGPAADIWSIGIIFYFLLTGKPLVDLFSPDANLRRYFGGKSIEQEATDMICDARVIQSKLSALREHAPKHICDLLELMLQPDPAVRPTVVQALMHPAIIESFVKHPRGQASFNSAKRPTFDAGVIDKMRAFIAAPALKRLAVLVEAHLLCPEDDELLRQEYVSFRIADKDGDGVVSVAELSEALASVGATVPRDLAKICRGIDVLQEGVITYTEFMAAAMDARVYTKEAFCKAVFRVLDADGDGRIGVSDLETILKPSARRKSVARSILQEAAAPEGMDFKGFLQFMLS